MEERLICYNGQSVMVSQEVAAFLEADRKCQQKEARSDRRHVAKMRGFDPDKALETKHHTGYNYLLNRVIRRERRNVVRTAIRALPFHLQWVYILRYEDGMTQQQIGDLLGISKMAVCKRLKKLEDRIRAALPDWPDQDFMVGGV